MLASVRHPFRSRVAPVASDLPSLAAPARVAVADAVDRDAPVAFVMLANGHPINREGV